MNSSIRYWLWLSTRRGLSSQMAYRLYQGFDSSIEKLYFATEDSLKGFPLKEKALAQLLDKNLSETEVILEQCQRLNLDILTFQDTVYPQILKSIADPPMVLYGKGKMPLIDEHLSLCMVGGRDATPYGIQEAMELSLRLTGGGAVMVTGMAEGVDSAVVEGALKAGGPLLSVVAGGIDRPFPKENAHFYEDVAQVGIVLSEYPPGTVHMGRNFPQRNRILSGLSDGVFVIECKASGGTMLTAKLAQEQERDLFALPSSVRSPMGEGPHLLIQKHGALLMTCGEDILEFYRHRYPFGELPTADWELKARIAESVPNIPVKTPRSKSSKASKAKKDPNDSQKRKKPTTPKSPQKPSPEPSPEPLGQVRLQGETFQWESPEGHSCSLSSGEVQVLRALEGRSLSTDILTELTGFSSGTLLSTMTQLELYGAVVEVAEGKFRSLVPLGEL